MTKSPQYSLGNFKMMMKISSNHQRNFLSELLKALVIDNNAFHWFLGIFSYNFQVWQKTFKTVIQPKKRGIGPTLTMTPSKNTVQDQLRVICSFSSKAYFKVIFDKSLATFGANFLAALVFSDHSSNSFGKPFHKLILNLKFSFEASQRFILSIELFVIKKRGPPNLSIYKH